MANRRMISRDIICSDNFLDMPCEAQALFFQLQVNADEYGFIQSPRGILRTMGASAETLEILISNGYVIRFDSGVIVMVHWFVANTMRADRAKPVRFPAEYRMLELDVVKAYRLHDTGMAMPHQREHTAMTAPYQQDVNAGLSTSPSVSISVSPKIASSSSIEVRPRENEDLDDDEPFQFSLERKLSKVPWLEGVTDRVMEYRSKLSDELIMHGLDRALEYGGHSMNYLRIILDGFVDNGYTTVEQAEADEEHRKQSEINGHYKPYRGLPGEVVV